MSPGPRFIEVSLDDEAEDRAAAADKKKPERTVHAAPSDDLLIDVSFPGHKPAERKWKEHATDKEQKEHVIDEEQGRLVSR